MKVNFDGMRKNATSEMNSLREIIETIIHEDTYQKIDEDLKEELINRFNNSASSVDMFNCLSDDTDENFNELDIDIQRIGDS